MLIKEHCQKVEKQRLPLKQLCASFPSLGMDASLLLSTPHFLKGFPGNRLEGPIWRSDAQQRPGFSVLHAPFGTSQPKQERLGSFWAGGPGNVLQSSAAVSEAEAFCHGQSSLVSACRGVCLTKWTPELLPEDFYLKKRRPLCKWNACLKHSTTTLCARFPSLIWQ